MECKYVKGVFFSIWKSLHRNVDRFNSVKINSNNRIHSHTWKCNVTLLERLQLLFRTNRPLALAALHFF